MTVKDEPYALVDRLTEADAYEALDYLRARIEPPFQPSQAFIEETHRALEQATAPGAVHIPHEAVRAWLETWGTPEEAAADEALRERYEREHERAIEAQHAASAAVEDPAERADWDAIHRAATTEGLADAG